MIAFFILQKHHAMTTVKDAAENELSSGYKRPKLWELHKKLFDEYFIEKIPNYMLQFPIEDNETHMI